MGAFLLSTEVINIAILFSQVKVQSADQSETFLISGIPKEYEDLTESVQLEWFLQDIDSDETVQVHADAYLYGEGEVVNATHAELCYFLDRIRLNPNFLESRCQSAGSSDFLRLESRRIVRTAARIMNTAKMQNRHPRGCRYTVTNWNLPTSQLFDFVGNHSHGFFVGVNFNRFECVIQRYSCYTSFNYILNTNAAFHILS